MQLTSLNLPPDAFNEFFNLMCNYSYFLKNEINHQISSVYEIEGKKGSR